MLSNILRPGSRHININTMRRALVHVNNGKIPDLTRHVLSFHRIHTQVNNESDTSVVLARKIVPADMNIINVIHGGQILQLAEDAGQIAAIKHCYSRNAGSDIYAKGISQTSSNIRTAAYLVQLNDMNFLHPIYVNELVRVRAEVVFVSQHSLAIEIEVTAENENSISRRVTNQGIFWYVNFNIDQRTQQFTIAEVPPLINFDSDKYQKCFQIYKQQKKSRQTATDCLKLSTKNKLPIQNDDDPKLTTPIAKNTVAASKCVLIQSVSPSDCYEKKYATGGFSMKLMDSAAAFACIKHCRCKVSTISMKDANFYKPVKVSNLAKVIGTLTFTSANSVEIFTRVITEDIWTGQQDIVATAYFNFAIIDKNYKVPPLVLTNDDEKRLFEEGRLRYENRKTILKKKTK